MGGLKPIGSEKLQGVDKINRIMEIARYKENTPSPVNESMSTEYSKKLSDGNTYVIAKEKNGYVIKRSLTESVLDADYIEPMKNRRYFSSYSQAFKRLNLIAKEVNVNEGYDGEISLFEQESKKYTLKTPKPAPAPAPEPSPEEIPSPEGDLDVDLDMDLEGGDDLDMDLEGGDDLDMDMGLESEEGEDESNFKSIQKLTGKLGQRLRSFTDAGNELTSKNIKYVINSILSAIDLSLLDDDDRDEIVEKFEEFDDTDYGMEDDEFGMDSDELDSSDLEGGFEDEPLGDLEGDAEVEESSTLSSSNRRKRQLYDDIYEDNDDDVSKIGDMFEELFSESKVDKVLEKYFQPSKTEKQLLENKKKNLKNIKTLSESVSQEVASIKFLKSSPDSKLIGKTNKNNLIFESNGKQVKISPKGIIL
jgi:hypothetical protein